VTHVVQIGESWESLSDLERLLRCTGEDAHNRISDILWDTQSDEAATAQLRKLANEQLRGWENASEGMMDDPKLETLVSG
jgi:hypothetical protein